MRGLAALVVVLLGASWYVFASQHSGTASSVRSDEGAYRTRLCELALWTGESARTDRLLEPREAQAVPYGSFAPAATAFVLGRTLPRAALDLQHGELDEDALVRGARGLWFCLAWFVSFALALAGVRFAAFAPKGVAGASIAWLAAVAWTAFGLLPLADGGSVRHEVWGLGLGAASLAACAQLSRPCSLLDQLGLAVGTGVLAGLAQCNDPFAWPLILAVLLAWWLAGGAQERPPWRARLRGAIYFLATALFVAGQGRAWSTGSWPWPDFDPGWQARSDGWGEAWIDVALVALVAWLVLAAPRGAQNKLLGVFLIAACVLRLCDARFASAPLAPAGCAFVACIVSLWQSGGATFARRAAALIACALLAGLAFRGTQGERDGAVVDALRSLRTLTRSSGAWNHGQARQEYALLANPGLAGSIAFHARRPVAGAVLPGAQPNATARSAADALLGSSPAELAARAHELNTPYLVVTRDDLERLGDLLALSGRRVSDFAPERAQQLVLHHLLHRREVPGFELLLRVPEPRMDGAPAKLALWRLTAPGPERAPASLRAR